jgi:phage repressor protein C with HTH and peptisase S24 domain
MVVKIRSGELMVKELKHRTARTIELVALNPAYADRRLAAMDVLWVARIVWASQ